MAIKNIIPQKTNIKHTIQKRTEIAIQSELINKVYENHYNVRDRTHNLWIALKNTVFFLITDDTESYIFGNNYLLQI